MELTHPKRDITPFVHGYWNLEITINKTIIIVIIVNGTGTAIN